MKAADEQELRLRPAYPYNDSIIFTPMFDQPLSKEQQTVYESLLAVPDQCLDGFLQAKKLKLPASHKKVKRIIVAGMGGSNLGMRIIRSVFASSFKLPIDLVNHYQLPAYADKSTLVVAYSYSGSTEETLMVAQQANKKRCPVVAVATGGKLIEWAKHKKVPALAFSATFNPAGQPRMAVGYGVFTLLGLFAQLGLKISEKEVKAIAKHLHNLSEEWLIHTPEMTNQPLRMAKYLHGFMPVYVASEHLEGNLQLSQNQTHETAKNFAAAFPLPELNHHLMEGLKNPKTYVNRLKFVAFSSNKYVARIQKRLKITQDVVEKQGLSWLSYTPSAKTKLGEACEILLFSSFTTFYLALMYKENPVIVPWVDYFKTQLTR